MQHKKKIDDIQTLADDLLVEPSARRAEYSRRNSDFTFESIDLSQIDDRIADGWELYKQGKTRARIRKRKSQASLLDDQTWCLLYRMGYPAITANRISVLLDREDGTHGTKELALLARDDETVVVVECRYRELRGKKNLQKDIADSLIARKAVVAAVKRRFGPQIKPKYLWLYVTRNVIWSDADVEKATQAKIRVITENEFQYFDSFIRHMGPAGRYQFLAEFFEGQDIPGLSEMRLPATRGVFAKQKFYSFVTTPKHLLKIAFVNHQALNHPDGNPAYQRMIAPSRIKSIEKFIEKGGYFPTNLLVNFNEPCRFDLLSNKENSDKNIKFGWLHLPTKYKSAWIIDGQHRLYGYSHLSDKYLDQPIAVIAFEMMPVTEEASLFVTINHEQKSVPKSILVSLQADLKLHSKIPKERLGALSSSVARALNVDPTSPFFQRFSSQGVTTQDNQSLTIPEVVNGVSRSGLLGKISSGNHAAGALTAVDDASTIKRAKHTINGYFDLIRNASPSRWEEARASYISTNPGVRGHLMLLAECCKYLDSSNRLDVYTVEPDELIEAVGRLIEPVLTFIQSATDEEVRDKFSRKFGEGGVKEYFENLCELVWRETPDFGGEEFKSVLARRNDQRRVTANAEVIELNRKIVDSVFAKLKNNYGESDQPGGKAYWVKGVANSNTRSAAYAKQQQDKNMQPLEAYLDVIDLKEIIKHKDNWALFQSTFSIRLPNEKAGKTYYLDWIDDFNELRRIPAHPSATRTYSEENYAFLRFIKDKLEAALAS